MATELGPNADSSSTLALYISENLEMSLSWLTAKTLQLQVNNHKPNMYMKPIQQAS